MSTRSASLVSPNPTADIALAPTDKGKFVTLADFAEVDCMHVNEKPVVASTIQSRSMLSTSREAQIAIAVLALVHLVITCVLVGSW